MDFADKFAGADVCITGGAGFIGSSLARKMLDLGAKVTVVDSLIPEYGGNLFNLDGLGRDCTINIADVRDPYAMRHLVQGRDYLFNLAGQTSHMDSMEDPFTDLEINARAQLSILEACRCNNPDVRVVFASTRQIYGRPEYVPVDEAHPVRPVDINGIHKLAGEWYHRLYDQVYGIPVSILRLTNTYGPRMRIKDARQTFVGVWIKNIVRGLPFEVWGGEQLRDFTYVDDCVEALLLCAASERARGKVYNLGGTAPVSLADLAALLVRVNGQGTYEVKAFPEKRKKIDIGDYYSDDRMMRNDLGWQPKVGLEEGLARTLEFYHQHMPHYL